MNRITIKNNTIDVAVSVYVYLDKEHPDGDIYVAYCPSLNLVGYGHGENEARKDFEYVLSDYLKEQMDNHIKREAH